MPTHIYEDQKKEHKNNKNQNQSVMATLMIILPSPGLRSRACAEVARCLRDAVRSRSRSEERRVSWAPENITLLVDVALEKLLG